MSAGGRAGLRIDRGRIRLADALLVYPERTLARGAPRPHGLAPAAVAEPGAVLAGVGPGEAVWLGFQAVDDTRPATVRVGVDSAPADAVLVCPPDYRLPGVYEEGRLTVSLDGPGHAEVEIRLVSLEIFTNLTGEPAEPLDPDSSYKGWRLP